MVEVIQIHLFKNGYPFGLDKQGRTTFAQAFRDKLNSDQIQSYRKNLQVFKALKCQHIISLDKLVKEEDSLHIYYQYQPDSLISHLKKLSKSTRSQNLHQMCEKLVQEINEAIQCIINCLISKKIMADLSLQNVAVDQKLKLKMFIQPQIQVLYEDDKQTGINSVLKDYYQTQRKKLQIQFQEQLQQIFGKIKQKQEINKSQNFVIKGTKLVFIKQAQTNKIQGNKNSFKNEKFDINSILDKNKMQKNLKHKQMHNQGAQIQQKKQKKIQNYFNQQVNDNYTKDASFYPEQFTKEDTFADIQTVCYEQELEKELQQLKRKEKEKKQKNVDHKKIGNAKGNNTYQKQGQKLSISNQIKTSKQQGSLSANQTDGSIKNRTCPNNSKQYTLSSNQNSRDTSQNNSHNDSYNSHHKKVKGTKINSLNNVLKEEDDHKNISQQQKSQQIKEHSSNQESKRKKYKMKIITSHEVEIQDNDNQNFDIKDLQKQIIDDIKNGSANKLSKQQPQKNSNINTKQNFNKAGSNNFNPITSSTPSSNSIKHIQKIQVKQKNLERPPTSKAIQEKNQQVSQPFSKTNHNIPSQNSKNSQNSQTNQIKANNYQNNQKSQGKEDISKLVQKLGLKLQQKKQQAINARQTINTQQFAKRQELHGNHLTSQQTSNEQQQQQYISKIQKAKNKAEQIMKIVKARKQNQQNE